MAISGPPPAANRRRNNKDTFSAEKVTLTEKQLQGFRKMPDGDWHPEVELWWSVWSTCAQSQLFTATDWTRLRTLLITRQSYQDRPTPQKMAELRQTEGLWGATYVDRMKARIKVEKAVPDDQEQPAGVSAMSEYRKRLAG